MELGVLSSQMLPMEYLGKYSTDSSHFVYLEPVRHGTDDIMRGYLGKNN